MDLDLLASHPSDIAAFALKHSGEGAALVFVIAVEGGSVRAPGLRMAIATGGQAAGFVSNGCVEADLVRVAQRAISAGAVTQVSYGRGAGRIDVVLPCGGRVDLLVVPVADRHRAVMERLAANGRDGGFLGLGPDGELSWSGGQSTAEWYFAVHPRIRLVVLGAGTEALFLARLGAASDMVVELHSPDDLTLARARELGLDWREMRGLSAEIGLSADAFTAVALMFHDHEWERRVLAEALAGPAFYVGALGSRRAHGARVDTLMREGLNSSAVARIKAPIGLVHQLRDPNLLAASVIAEIAAEFQARFTAF